MSICNHLYTGSYQNSPQSMRQRCPYPEFYDSIRLASLPASEVDTAQTLPIDDRGVCIFHSRDLSWKRQNNLKGKFLQLVQLLDMNDAERYYDFREFVFLGSDVRTKAGVKEHLLRITDVIFQKQVYFTGASFLDTFELEKVEFRQGAMFDHATFHHDVTFEKARINGLDFAEATFNAGVYFRGVESLSFALFSKAHFAGIEKSPLILFKDTRFEGITDFSGADFTMGDQSAVCFNNVQFQDFTDFRNTHFNCQVEFSDVSFADTTEFIDTSFDIVHSTARYRGTAVEFNRIQITDDAVLTFMSTDAHNKMFNHDVKISFKEDPSGTIRLENVNLSLFTPSSKEHLTRLAKLGRVEIGSGCIKYRFQTAVQTISVSQGNVPLILELCQTFANYFTGSNGLNLGFEIVERDKTKVSFFYFTDEDISEQAFYDRLLETKQSLWELLSIDSEDQFPNPGEPIGADSPATRKSAIINAVDAISALVGTFFRVGARVALGAWNYTDTAALLNAIPLNQEGDSSRAPSLHRLLVERYTRSKLFGLSGELNNQLFLEGKVAALTNTVELLGDKAATHNYTVTGKQVAIGSVGPNAEVNKLNIDQTANMGEQPENQIKILLLSANPTGVSTRNLDEEVREIVRRVRDSSHRDRIRIVTAGAVRPGDLLQAMNEHEPHVVQFSGYGNPGRGILVCDEKGNARAISGEALAALFHSTEVNVQVVVLNACYSKPEAEAIATVIPCVIGMKGKIGREAARVFAAFFYGALGFGRSVEVAFKQGLAALKLHHIPESDVPELILKSGVKASEITPVNPALPTPP